MRTKILISTMADLCGRFISNFTGMMEMSSKTAVTGDLASEASNVPCSLYTISWSGLGGWRCAVKVYLLEI